MLHNISMYAVFSGQLLECCVKDGNQKMNRHQLTESICLVSARRTVSTKRVLMTYIPYLHSSREL